MIGQIPEPSTDVKKFVKAVLIADNGELEMGWFRAGAQYMDGITCTILSLPDSDPTLGQMLKSLADGTFYDAETVARNVLRWDMARPELDAFIKANAAKSNSPTLLMHARALIQDATKPRMPLVEPSLWDFWVANMKIVFWVSPIVTWMIVRRAWGSSFGIKGSLRQRWAAALRDPAWWAMVILIAAGVVFTLS